MKFVLLALFLAFAFVDATAAQTVKKKTAAEQRKAAAVAEQKRIAAEKKKAAAERKKIAEQIAEQLVDSNQVSFFKVFGDSSGKFFFTYPIFISNHAALQELQRNFIRQRFGENYLGQGPVMALNLYKNHYKELEFLTDEVYFPMSGVVLFITYSEKITNHCNYAISDGKKIELKDIFNNGWEAEVTKLIINEFLRVQNVRSFIEYDYTQKESDFMPTSVKIGHDGLEFYYPASKIAPYVVGEQLVFLSWNTLKPHLNPESAIYHKIKF